MDRPDEKSPLGELRTRRSRRPQPQVLIAPLIDIVFILLIFFMLVARFLNPGIAVALPESESDDFDESRSGTVIVKPDGSTWLDDAEMPLEEITLRLSELHESGNIETVRLRGDRKAEWQLVVSAMDAIRDAGIYDIVIETESETVN